MLFRINATLEEWELQRVQLIGGFMQTSQILNLGPKPNPSENENPQVPHPSDDFNQLGDLMEQTRSDVRRIRTQLERQEDEQESHGRRTKILYIAVGVLILIFALATWFAYPALRDHDKTLADMFGLQNFTGGLSERIHSVEGKLEKTNAGLPELSTRMDQLGTSMKSALQTARTQASAAATQMGQRIKADLTQSIQAIQSRVAGLESNQRETSGHVNQLEEQITSLKRELASMQDQSTAAAERIKQLQEEQQTRATAMTGLDQKMASHQAALESLNNRVDAKRVDFEIQKNKTQEIAPGLFLTVQRADAGKQQIDGKLQVSADSRMMPIRAQGTQIPVVFYSTGENRPMQLVFTKVEKNSVSGYVMVPNQQTVASK